MEEKPWDPFGDFETRGILRNSLATKDKKILANLEYVSVTANMADAVTTLRFRKHLDTSMWMLTHKKLLSDVYPWAGTLRHVDVVRGPVRFNFKEKVISEADSLLRKASNPEFFSENLGLVYGEMAFNHPFLDGNGRSMNTMFTEFARRAGFGIAWDKVDKEVYLNLLTKAVMLKDYKGLGEYFESLKVPLAGYNPKFSISQASIAENTITDPEFRLR